MCSSWSEESNTKSKHLYLTIPGCIPVRQQQWFIFNLTLSYRNSIDSVLLRSLFQMQWYFTSCHNTGRVYPTIISIQLTTHPMYFMHRDIKEAGYSIDSAEQMANLELKAYKCLSSYLKFFFFFFFFWLRGKHTSKSFLLLLPF